MAKQQILLVDADSSSARVLEVSLRSAGFTVTSADSAESALEKLEHGSPDLILTDTRLPGADGFAFVRGLRARAELKEVPIVFLTEQGALEDKLRGLELGVDDYLAKPIFVREVVTRVHMLLARKNQQRIATESLARTRFSGSLEDVAVVDLLQTIAISGKSGVAVVRRGDREAQLYFRSGQLVDAEVGDLRGEEAVYRTITWTTGTFDLEFRPVDRTAAIEATMNALLMEGLRRVDELGRLAEQLPPENTVIDIDHDALLGRLNEIPDELNGILRLIDGKRTLLDLIDGSPFDDLSTLTVLSKFYFEGLLVAIEAPAEAEAVPASGQGSAGSGVATSDPSGVVLGTSAPAGRSEIPPPVAAAEGNARQSSRGNAPGLPSPSAPSAELAAAPPATQRAPEPAQPLRVLVPHDDEVRTMAAAADPSVMADKPTMPAPSAPAPQPRSSVGAPVARSGAPAGDPLKVTPKVILNVGDDGITPSRAAPPKSVAAAAQNAAHGASSRSEPLAANGHVSNGFSRHAYSAPAVARTEHGLAPAEVAPTRGTGTLRPPAPASALPAPAASTPLDIGAHLSASSPWADTASEARMAFTPVPPSAASDAEVPSDRVSPAPEVYDAAPPGPPRFEFQPAELPEVRNARVVRAPPLPVPEEPAQRDPDPLVSDERVSEAEFFDAGDEGTYAGGPRSSIPAPDEEEYVEPDFAPAVGYHSTPAQQARVRRSTLMVGALLALAAIPLLIAVWRNFAAEEGDPMAARDPAAAPAAMEPEREGTELSAPSSSTPSLSPAPQAAPPPAAASSEAALADPSSVSASGGTESVATPAPPAPTLPPAAEAALAAPASVHATPAAPRAVPAAAKPSEAPPARVTRASSPEAPPKRAPAPSKRRRAAAEPTAKPLVAPKLEPEAPIVPRRSSSDKPPTAAYPPL